MSLNGISKNLNINTTAEVLEQLNGILDTSQAAVSFWGTRQVSYKGERVSFTQLAQKVSIAADFCRENGLDELRREQWISISQKIAAFYDKSDVAIKNKNFITRFFVSVREFTLFPYTQRFFYEEGIVESHFCSYSKEALEKLKEFIGTVDTNGSSSPPPREHVTEEAIRKKAQMDRLAYSTPAILSVSPKSTTSEKVPPFNLKTEKEAALEPKVLAAITIT